MSALNLNKKPDLIFASPVGTVVLAALLAIIALPASPLLAQDDGADNAAAESAPPEVISIDLPLADPPSTDKPETKAKKDNSKYAALLASLTIFVLAVFVGFEVITKVQPTLHTPLMSG